MVMLSSSTFGYSGSFDESLSNSLTGEGNICCAIMPPFAAFQVYDEASSAVVH